MCDTLVEVEVIMEIQNVTLSIPKSILYKAKLLAVERQTSLSGLLVQALIEIVEHRDGYEKACQHHLAWLTSGADLGTQGNVPWTREEVHER
jgi:hypothetical protein